MKKEPRLEDYIEVILRRKWILILAVAVIFISTVVLSLLQTPIYESFTTLHLKKRLDGARSDASIFGEFPTFATPTEINTQVEILKSRSMMEEIAKRLNLAGNLEATISQVARALKRNIFVELIRDTRLIKITFSSPSPEFARNVVSALAQVAIEKGIESRRMETTAALNFISQQVEKMGENLQLTEERLRDYKEKEGFMQLSTEAELKVRELSDLESSFEGTTILREEMEVRLIEVRRQLSAVDKTRMSSVTISNNPIVQMLKTRLTERQIELAQLKRQFSENAPEVVQVKSKIEEIENQLRDQVETIISGKTESVNPVYTTLYSRLISYETDLIALRAKEDALNKLVKDYQQEVNKLPQQELELARLERESRVSEGLYTLLLTKQSEVRIQAASEIGNLEVVDPAIISDEPVKPRTRLNALLGLITGMICGLGLAFFTEYLDKTIKTEEQVKDVLDLPVLGVILKLGSGMAKYGYPYYHYGRKRKRKEKETQQKAQMKMEKTEKVKKKKKEKEQEKIELISLTKPKSTISESFRILRTNLQFVDLEKKMKTLLVTSSIPKEGKTCIAANLAITFALSGEKTLLIDADLRNPGVHKIFEVPRDPGLTNLLTGKQSYQSAVKTVKNLDNFHILTTGPLPPNPSEILGSLPMKELIATFKENYDKVIFDTPPSITLTDAPVLSTSVEGVLLLLGAGEVEEEAAQRAKEALGKVKANIVGVVLNKVVLERRGYGSYYYRYYYYYYHPEEN